MTVPTLITPRLTLRAPVPDDAAAFVAALNTPEVHRWLNATPVPYRREDALWFINEIAEGRARDWAIEQDGTFCGVIGCAVFGYWLAPEAWGKGYATEAGRVVLDHFFETAPELQQIPSGHHNGNHRSRRVLQKLGFIDVGPKIAQRQSEPREVPGRRMLLTRDAWERARL